jgi:hydrogenase maturation protein HypF
MLASIPQNHEVSLLRIRKRLHIQGCVQGVGFRPFVYRIAHECGVTGEVSNTPQGVVIEIEAASQQIKDFIIHLHTDLPFLARIDSCNMEDIDSCLSHDFRIIPSQCDGENSSIILPDIAACPECMREVFDPSNRRYLYPFTNCTHCGPRFSIIHNLPYDRFNTTMAKFTMCDQCQTEYDDPNNRRFHAQPNACPNCGPHVELWDESGTHRTNFYGAILNTVQLLQQGNIVAIKGLGGFHLMVDARNNDAVLRLRQRKHRYEKPLAVMAPNMAWVEQLCECNESETTLLQSYQSPIVVVKRKSLHNSKIAESVAGSNPYLGVMLPYTPLHHIFMRLLDFPIVATSGNLSDEPICIGEHEAIKRLHGIADYFLIHNRPIVRHVDDSVVRVFRGQEQIIRRARGYAPLPIAWKDEMPSMLAVGGHLKNTVAITKGKHIFISQHIGDLESQESLHAFEEVQHTLQNTYQCKPSIVIHDMHPDYLSTKHAESLGIETVAVQHHHAHVLSCMAEHHLDGNVFGIAWDGTGFGTDNTIWGSEFLHVNGDLFQRFASWQTFPLPGGESAIKNTKQIAIGLLYSLYGDDVFTMQNLPFLLTFKQTELRIIQQMLHKNMNCPFTSSMGRLFDAVAAITGIRNQIAYEGQAAIELEWQTIEKLDKSYDFSLNINSEYDDPNKHPQYKINIKPMIDAILHDMASGLSTQIISTRFHNTLAEIIIAVAKMQNEQRVVLSGGCFQNQYLLHRSIQRLEDELYEVYWHKQIPMNDGGISLGQAVFGSLYMAKKET